MDKNLIVDLGQSGARIKIGEEITSLSIAKTASATVLETLELIFKEVPHQDFETVYLSLTGLYGVVSGEQVIGELCQNQEDPLENEAAENHPPQRCQIVLFLLAYDLLSPTFQ